MRRRPGRGRAGEGLHESNRLVLVERGQARERVGPEEVAGEVVQDVVELEIDSGLHLVRAARPRDRVGSLPAIDRGFTRAERIAADREHRRTGLLDDRLRIRAVCLARFLVARPLEPRLVEQCRPEDGRDAGIERTRTDVGIASVLEGDLRATILEVLAVEVLMVVAQCQPIVCVDLVIGLDQEDVLVLPLIPARGQRLQLGDSGHGIGVGRRARRDVYEHEIRERVALRVGVDEDEVAVEAQRTTEDGAELVVVVR